MGLGHKTRTFNSSRGTGVEKCGRVNSGGQTRTGDARGRRPAKRGLRGKRQHFLARLERAKLHVDEPEQGDLHFDKRSAYLLFQLVVRR